MRGKELTAERLREVLDYDPETGAFTWRVSLSVKRPAGTKAGCVDKGIGYVRVRIDKVCYHAHRLAWMYIHGAWPAGRVDHIDLDRGNNRIANLRIATMSQNIANTRRRTSTLGVKGVTPYRRKDGTTTYIAQIMKNYRHHHLGMFDTVEEAGAAYAAAAKSMFGEFARTE